MSKQIDTETRDWKDIVRKAFGPVSWFIPLVVMGGTALIFAPLRTHVTAPWNAPAEVWFGISAQLLMLSIWVYFEQKFAANPTTTTKELKHDHLVSAALALGFTVFGGGMIVLQIVPWFYVLPWIGSIIDLIGSTQAALDNATQKPVFQNTKPDAV